MKEDVLKNLEKLVPEEDRQSILDLYAEIQALGNVIGNDITSALLLILYELRKQKVKPAEKTKKTPKKSQNKKNMITVKQKNYIRLLLNKCSEKKKEEYRNFMNDLGKTIDELTQYEANRLIRMLKRD